MLADYFNTTVGHVQVFNKKTGELVYEDKNKIMIPSSECMAMRMFNFSSNQNYVSPTYNQVMDLDHNHAGTGNDLTFQYKVCLFCMGTSGCAKGSQIKYEVSNKKWINPEDLVPFKYVEYNNDLNNIDRNIYFGRKLLPEKEAVAYYFKKFDSNPVINRQYENGTNWTTSIYDDDSTLRANVRVGLTFTIDEQDGRDYFDKTTGINDALFNTIELLAAWTEVIDGYTYYQDVRPFTRLNMPHKYLSSNGDSYEFKYYLYF